MYTLTMQFNGERVTKDVKNVKKGILSSKPDVLLTEMYVTLEKDGDIRERKLNLTQGKKLFNNEDFLDVFVMNLLLK